jgi:hypothetical protein
MTQTQPTTRPPKAVYNPDAQLLALVEEHDRLYEVCNGEDEVPAELIYELCELERQITARPVFTAAGLAGKTRVVERAEYDDDDCITREIMRLDHARVTGG